MTDRRDPLSTYLPVPIPRGPGVPKPAPAQPAYSKIWDAGTTTARADLPSAERDRLYDAYTPILEELNKDRSWFRRYHNPGAGGANFETYLFDDAGNPVTHAPKPEDQEQHLWAAIDAKRMADPNAFPGVPKTRDELHDQILANAKAKLRDARGTLSANQTWTGSAVSMGAGVATSFQDQYQIMALPLGGVGRSMAMRIGTAALGNMAVEAVEQPMVADQREKLGEKLTGREAAINIATAGVFGGGFQAVGDAVVAPAVKAALNTASGRAATDAVANVFEQGRDVARQMRQKIGWANMTPPEKIAALSLERQADIATTSPFVAGAGTDAHVARMEATVAGLKAGDGLPPIAPAAPRFDTRIWANKAGAAESGGQWNIGAKTSSAYGMYQITKGTWSRVAKNVPSLRSMTEEAAWERRTNPAAQEAVFNALTQENRAALARIGAPETYGNMYLMHFAGSGGAAKILKAAPDTPIERILSEKAIAANGFLRGKTADDVVRWAHAKMGETPHEGPVLSREGFDDHNDGDVEWRAAQAEVDAAERQMADARTADVDEAIPRSPIEDDVPFDLDDPRGIVRDGPQRDPFEDVPGDMVDAVPSRVDGVDEPSQMQTAPDDVTAIQPERRGDVATDLAPPRVAEQANVEGIQAGRVADAVAGAGVSTGSGDGVAYRYRDPQSPQDEMNTYWAHQRDTGGSSQPVWTMRDDTGAIVKWAPEKRMLERELDKEFFPERFTLDEATPGDASPRDIEPSQPTISTTPEPIAGFDHPDDVAAVRQIDSIVHDLKMLIDEQPNIKVRVGEEGAEQPLADILSDLDADEAALNAAKACM